MPLNLKLDAFARVEIMPGHGTTVKESVELMRTPSEVTDSILESPDPLKEYLLYCPQYASLKHADKVRKFCEEHSREKGWSLTWYAG